MKYTAIYLRVSSRTQDTASQEPDLQRWAAAQTEPVKWFTDTFTGKSMARPGWQQIEAGIAKGEINRVVVWRLDRLGRTAKGLTTLFHDLIQAKVNLVSMKDALDLSTASGRLFANMLAAIAQFETECRMERVTAGQDVARAKGKRWGGSKPGKLTKQNAKPEQIEAIHQLHKEGKSITHISKALKVSRPTVYKYLPA